MGYKKREREHLKSNMGWDFKCILSKHQNNYPNYFFKKIIELELIFLLETFKQFK